MEEIHIDLVDHDNVPLLGSRQENIEVITSPERKPKIIVPQILSKPVNKLQI
jgi:hypothetical protein